jgi:hypothetical protein
VTPAPESTQAPIPKIPTVSTYTAPAYAYSFNYPSNWVDITNAAPSLRFEYDPNVPDLKQDVVLGVYQDEYNAIAIICQRNFFSKGHTLEETILALEKTGASPNRIWVNNREAVETGFNSPSTYSNIKNLYLMSGSVLYWFTVVAVGETYYESFAEAYSILIESLQIR